MGEYQPIGEMLVSKGKITPEQLYTALRGKKTSRKRIGEVLVELGAVSELDITECLAEQFGFTIINPSKVHPESQALELLSGDIALSHRILPFRYNSDCIECVMADPIDFPTTDMISRLAGRRAAIYLATSSALIASIAKAYRLILEKPAAKHKAAERLLLKPQKDRASILEKLEQIICLEEKQSQTVSPNFA